MKILVPATSANLGPGFDTLGLSIALYNEINITPNPITTISIKGEGEDKAHLKTKNSFVTIFNEKFYELTGNKENFRFDFHNKIPLSRGLGSSSAVIVGAIASAYHLANKKVDKEEILNLALAYESHPDNIAPATFGGFTVSIVKDGRVFTQKKELPSEICAILVIPDRAMSTAKSRTQLPKHYSMKETVSNLSHAAALSVAFFNESWESLSFLSKDLMHEERRMRQMPELFEVRKVALNSGALMSTLSGSGSTFFNLAFKNEAKNIEKNLKKEFPHFKILTLDFDNQGFFIKNS